jgi:hypothetical protein
MSDCFHQKEEEVLPSEEEFMLDVMKSFSIAEKRILKKSKSILSIIPIE